MFQGLLTFGVALPSFITAFTLAASLEYAGKKRGSRGLLGFFGKLPYLDPNRYLFAYLIAGLILFIFGGLTGIVNASGVLNAVVHNTAWMPGHFHMTVAGPVFLSIIGMSLFLYSGLIGKAGFSSPRKCDHSLVMGHWHIDIFHRTFLGRSDWRTEKNEPGHDLPESKK